ncbi:MAG: hypothetical protein Q8Q40_02350 [Methylococcaceae bacterium]|nr:hypothetical protein [Methylococcaceae bacterium]MDP3902801.1 hypothetical protein [Methylococcaceae bacterium]
MNDMPNKPRKTYSSDEQIRRAALEALRRGDFDFALKAVERGEASIPEMVEDLKIYQAELEVQNEELRQAQLRSDLAIQRFTVTIQRQFAWQQLRHKIWQLAVEKEI